MPATATEKRKSTARRARPATPKKAGGKVAKHAAGKATKTAAGEVTKAPKRAAKGAAKLAAKKAASKAGANSLETGSRVVRLAVDRAAAAIVAAREAAGRERLPIQVSVDVAVPINIAWAEWMKSGSLPEGVHRIHEIERDGDKLGGWIAGPRGGDWQAEILDEREAQSFAWRSTKGSDCAGLVTFHQLSERLTRIELNLDVIPTNASEAVALALHLAHHRAEADVRRFKAGVEFINPDVYAG
jgi:uncharacterized membrane protein